MKKLLRVLLLLALLPALCFATNTVVVSVNSTVTMRFFVEGNLPITYKLERASPTEQFTVIGEVTSSDPEVRLIDNRVENGVEYTYRMILTNSVGSSEYSTTVGLKVTAREPTEVKIEVSKK